MRPLREAWRELMDYLKWASTHDDPALREFQEVCDKAARYDLIHRHYPNILARLNAAADLKQRK